MNQVIRALTIVSFLFAFSPSSQAGIGGSGGGPGAASFMRFTVCEDAYNMDCSVVEYQIRATDGLAVATKCHTDSDLERAALCVGAESYMGWAQRLSEAYRSF